MKTTPSIVPGNDLWSRKLVRAGAGLLLAGLSLLPARATRYSVTDLGTLGGTLSQANGINGSGMTVGVSQNAAKAILAFRYSGGAMIGLPTLPGSTSTTGSGINASGTVVGTANYAGGGYRAFLYDGATHDLGALPGGTNATATGVNDAGAVVGTAELTGGISRAFLYDGTMHDLGTLPGGGNSAARAINRSGKIVGYNQAPDGTTRAFLYDGTMHDLGTLPGATDSVAQGLNDRDVVVGTAGHTDGSHHAFLYDGTMHDLGTLPGTSDIVAQAINNTGIVVGFYITPDGGARAFLYDGALTDLNAEIPSDSGWVLWRATAINDLGQIVGWGTVGGNVHGFLLTPGTTSGAPTLTYVRNPDGSVTISTDGILTAADELGGSYLDLDVKSVTIPPSSPIQRRFYRARSATLSPTLTYTRNADGSVTISTNGTLTEAAILSGPYLNLGVHSVTINPSPAMPMRFYRATN